MNAGIKAGDVVLVGLPAHQPKGHEQEGVRPAIITAVPQGYLRYPVVIVIPVTSQTGNWAKRNPSLYKQIPEGCGGLPRPSVALIDQVRAVDVSRVRSYIGTLEQQIFQIIKDSLIELLSI